MPETAKIDQAPASLLGEKEKPPPPAPQLVTGQPSTPERVDQVFDEQWVKAFVSYVGSVAAEGTGIDDMKLTSFELAMLVPPLTRVLNRTGPAMLARAFPGVFADDDPTPLVLAAVILLIGMRRILVWRRRRREEREAKRPPARREQQRETPAPASPALHVMTPPGADNLGPEPETPDGPPPLASGMSGQPTGGYVGDGRLR